QQSPKNLFNLNWTSAPSPNTFLEVSSSYFHMHWPTTYSDEFFAQPEGSCLAFACAGNVKSPALQNLTTGVFAGAAPQGENLRDRSSFYDAYLPEQTGGGGRWFSVQTYPQLDAGYNWKSFAPRTSIVFKLTEDGRNVAKASYSRYYDVMYTTEFADVINPNVIRGGKTTAFGVATYRWLGDLNGNGVLDDNEYDHNPISTFAPRLNTI